MKQMLSMTASFAVISVLLICFYCCGSEDNAATQTAVPVYEKMPTQFSFQGWVEDYWEGDVHYKIFYRSGGHGMQVVNYTADSIDEALNRQYFSFKEENDRIGIGTNKVDSIHKIKVFSKHKCDTLFIPSSIIRDTINKIKFNPIVNHSKIPS